MKQQSLDDMPGLMHIIVDDQGEVRRMIGSCKAKELKRNGETR